MNVEGVQPADVYYSRFDEVELKQIIGREDEPMIKRLIQYDIALLI